MTHDDNDTKIIKDALTRRVAKVLDEFDAPRLPPAFWVALSYAMADELEARQLEARRSETRHRGGRSQERRTSIGRDMGEH